MKWKIKRSTNLGHRMTVAHNSNNNTNKQSNPMANQALKQTQAIQLYVTMKEAERMCIRTISERSGYIEK